MRLLKEYWPIIAAVLAFASATGVQQVALIRQDRAQQQQMAEQQARIDERTKSLKQSSDTQQRLLELILEKVSK